MTVQVTVRMGVAPTMAARNVVSFGIACVTTPPAVLGWLLTIAYPQSHPAAHLATLAVAGGIAVIAWISLIIGWHIDRVLRQLETTERRVLVHLIDNAVNGGG